MIRIFFRGSRAIGTFLLLVLLSFAQTSCTSSSAKIDTSSPYLGVQVPDFTLADYEGNQVQLADYKGKYLLIHFATTWCPFCNAEAPNLENLYQKYVDRGVEVLIIDVKEDRELVKKELIDRFSLSFPVLFDKDGRVAASYAPEAVLPDLARDEVMLASNLLITPDAKIRFFSLLDSQNFDAKLVDLTSVLDELLKSDYL